MGLELRFRLVVEKEIQLIVHYYIDIVQKILFNKIKINYEIKKNKLNLSRAIAVEVKKQVRRDSGYACVICGTCPYVYEHIEPEFKDPKIHDK